MLAVYFSHARLALPLQNNTSGVHGFGNFTVIITKSKRHSENTAMHRNYSHAGVVRMHPWKRSAGHKQFFRYWLYTANLKTKNVLFVLFLPRPWIETTECKESALAYVYLLHNRTKKSKLQKVIHVHFPSPPAYYNMVDGHEFSVQFYSSRNIDFYGWLGSGWVKHYLVKQ